MPTKEGRAFWQLKYDLGTGKQAKRHARYLLINLSPTYDHAIK